MAVVSDPIADMLTRIRNAITAGHASVSIPGSKIKQDIAKILLEEGFISSHSYQDDGVQGRIEVSLRYVGSENAIHGLKRVSKPGCRVYSGVKELPKIRNGLGISILSTSQGVMSGRQARKSLVGGEVLCHIW